MSAGDIVQPVISKVTANQRADTIDINQLARTVRDQITSVLRTILITPRNASGTPVGTIYTGFSLFRNPTPSDGVVRINSELGIAIDSDGKYIIKPAGTSVNVAIPATGTPHQIYVYYTENEGPVDYRRFISPTPPHVESSNTVSTTLTASYGVHVRVGDLASCVAEDTVNGRTRSLVLIGIATNTVGTITITGHSVVSAPNGTDITNRLSAVTPPATPTPVTPYRNAGWRTEYDKLNAALYALGLAKWQNSLRLTPSTANNYGAYETVNGGGLDVAVRGRSVEVTIASDSDLAYGDINTNNYASVDLAIAAAIALLPGQGGTIVYRVQHTLTLAGNVTIPANKYVRIRGALDIGNDTLSPALNMATFRFVCASGNAAPRTLSFENLRLISSDAAATGGFVELHHLWTLSVTDCQFTYNSTYSAGSPVAMISWNAATVITGDVWLRRSQFRYSNASNAQAGILASTGVHTGDIVADSCIFGMEGNASTTPLHCCIRVADLQNNFLISKCTFYANGTSTAFSPNGYTGIALDSTQNSTDGKVLRSIQDCSFLGLLSGTNSAFVGIALGAISNVRVMACDFVSCVSAITITTTAAVAAHTLIDRCMFDASIHHSIVMTVSNGAYDGITITNNRWLNTIADTNAFHVVGSSAGHNIRYLVFNNNHLADGRVVITSNMSNCAFSSNRFARSAHTNYQALSIGRSNTADVLDVTITGNQFVGCRSPTVAPSVTLAGLCVLVYGNTVQNLVITQNTCSDVGNATYTPSTAFDQSVFRVLGIAVTSVNITANQFSNIGRLLTVSTTLTPHAIQLITVVATTVGTGSSNGNAEGVAITGNVCGDILSRVSPIHVEGFVTVKGLTISDNSFAYDLFSQVPYVAGGIVIRTYDGTFTGIYRNIVISNNTFRYAGNPVGLTNLAVVSMASTFHNVRIVGNLWSCTTLNGHTAGAAMVFEGTWRYFSFINNSGFIEGDTNLTNAKFSFAGGGSTSIISDPAYPAVGAYWGSNFNIQRNS